MAPRAPRLRWSCAQRGEEISHQQERAVFGVLRRGSYSAPAFCVKSHLLGPDPRHGHRSTVR